MFGQVQTITDKILERDKSTRFLFATFTVKNVAVSEYRAAYHHGNCYLYGCRCPDGVELISAMITMTTTTPA